MSNKCFPHHFMTIEEYGLYCYALAVSHDTGILYFDGPDIAARFDGQSKNTPYRIAASLLGKGFFEVACERKRDARGIWRATQYRVMPFEEWLAKHPKAKCKACVSPSPNSGMAPSPKSKTTIPKNGNIHPRFEGLPSPNSGNNLNKRNSNKRNKTTPTPLGGGGGMDFSNQEHQDREIAEWMKSLSKHLSHFCGAVLRDVDRPLLRDLFQELGPHGLTWMLDRWDDKRDLPTDTLKTKWHTFLKEAPPLYLEEAKQHSTETLKCRGLIAAGEVRLGCDKVVAAYFNCGYNVWYGHPNADMTPEHRAALEAIPLTEEQKCRVIRAQPTPRQVEGPDGETIPWYLHPDELTEEKIQAWENFVPKVIEDYRVKFEAKMAEWGIAKVGVTG